MTPYICHTLYLVACSILPERECRRHSEGSRKETTGSVIRARCKTMRPGTPAGSLYLISPCLIVRQSIGAILSAVVKRSVITRTRSLCEIHQNSEIIVNYSKIRVDSPCVAGYTLNDVKNAVKRTRNRDMTFKSSYFRGKTLPNIKRCGFWLRLFFDGGVYFNDFRKSPLSPTLAQL